ncbi:hypothetical protein ACLF3G_22035 [Falsiroseomonas sp. HC035]|uniref:hypothetical protein n=1 Tax=Falsiroseomonas sp. HC035 TaxID=3390999 RepID=UPI003D317562
MSVRLPPVGLVLVLLAGALLAGCGTPLRSAAGGEAEYLPEDLPLPRARRPSSERPPWLPVLPPNIPRIRTDEGLRASLG